MGLFSRKKSYAAAEAAAEPPRQQSGSWWWRRSRAQQPYAAAAAAAAEVAMPRQQLASDAEIMQAAAAKREYDARMQDMYMTMQPTSSYTGGGGLAVQHPSAPLGSSSGGPQPHAYLPGQEAAYNANMQSVYGRGRP